MSAKQCPECGGYGHHAVGCEEAEAEWPTPANGDDCKPLDAVAEIMAHFITIYGRHEAN